MAYNQDIEQQPLNVNAPIVVAPGRHYEHNYDAQPVIVVPMQHQPARQQMVVQPQPRPIDDDPTCLYVAACFSLFIPLVGFLTMCCYGCGNNLGPRQRSAFTIMAICTIIGCLWGIIVGIIESPPTGYNHDI